MQDNDELEAVVAAVKESRKYRDTSEQTIRELAAEALLQYKKQKQAIKAVRRRLHSIMAPYLGDPDYEAATSALEAAFASGDEEHIRTTCEGVLYAHLSTRERLPILDSFYDEIFAVTGSPQRLLDVACGLNPLALRWMDLAPNVEYFAYDIHEPRIDFINRYFQLEALPPLARLQDVALQPPREPGDVALFLKEMPRFERNYPGQGRVLLEVLPVKYLVISFPTVSTHGGRSLVQRYRDFFSELVQDKSWPVTELMFDGEMVFIAEKAQ